MHSVHKLACNPTTSQLLGHPSSHPLLCPPASSCNPMNTRMGIVHGTTVHPGLAAFSAGNFSQPSPVQMVVPLPRPAVLYIRGLVLRPVSKHTQLAAPAQTGKRCRAFAGKDEWHISLTTVDVGIFPRLASRLLAFSSHFAITRSRLWHHTLILRIGKAREHS